MAHPAPSIPDHLRDIAILLDVDGTVLDVASTPGEVYAPPSLLRTLSRLSQLTAGALALVSGRSIDDLDRIFAPLRLPAVGGHGAEIRPGPDGTPRLTLAPPLDDGLRRRLSAIAKLAPGVIVEDKGYALALHYRLAPAKESAVKQAVAAMRTELRAARVEILPGKAVVEIKPAGLDKGTALRELMKYPTFAGRCPVFVGDDTTDEAAFAVLPAFEGLGISVGRMVPGVACRFGTPRDVRRWLAHIADGEGAVAR